jgi:hypothetical protein
MTWAASAATKTDGVFSVTQPVTILGNEEPTFAMLPTVSADEKTIFVGSYDRVEGKDVWLIIGATRENIDDPFSGAARIPSLVDASSENQPNWISRDGCRIYFHRDGTEGGALWMASRPDLE